MDVLLPEDPLKDPLAPSLYETREFERRPEGVWGLPRVFTSKDVPPSFALTGVRCATSSRGDALISDRGTEPLD